MRRLLERLKDLTPFVGLQRQVMRRDDVPRALHEFRLHMAALGQPVGDLTDEEIIEGVSEFSREIREIGLNPSEVTGMMAEMQRATGGA